MSRIVSDVKMPKLSFCFGFSRRAVRSATIASSMAGTIWATSRGFTLSDSDRRDPKIMRNWASGMTANSSCDRPSSDPRFELTPTIRK